MRLAIISDIHSNLEALQTALRAIERVGVDRMYCLGDVVGYNANPVECMHLVAEHCDGVVVGNHDLAVATGDGIEQLPPDAQKAARHNQELLSDTHREEILSWPDEIVEHDCTFVHATPDEPRAWKRINSFPAAKRQFEHFDTPVCFVGHTHVPSVVSDRLGVLKVRPGHRFMINPGSIGQPRDNNPKLSFALFDTASMQYRNVRLDYDMETTARKLQAAGLPDRLAHRLLEGA
ncbi:metallophosphoesterase family protein [Longibacter salinarum]|uniref:metallophosphoesterase family protein n=1 Tax=Longibacter salinarum TaxID=1850348 RepID=UPI0015CF588C|nr:metallophosphoesterase family protein [Longibacter salinarum]